MGTFTVSYWARRAIWDKRQMWLGTAVVYWIGTCWDRAGYDKASMMKGHSMMFADRHKSIPEGKDPWKW